MRSSGIALFQVMLLCTFVTFGQATGPRFEAATIKLNTSIRVGYNSQFDPERFTFTNGTVQTLIENAYRLKAFQIIGGPNWINSDKWDIAAKAEGPTSISQKFDMVKTLLADRFRMKSHFESRELSLYSLSALDDGPKFHLPKDGENTSLKIGYGSLIAQKYNVAYLADLLTSQLNTQVIDTANLKGFYDFKLEWTPAPNEGDFLNREDVPTSVSANGPSIFTALKEQLGLALQKGKGPVQVLVIDSIDKPSEN